LIAGAVLFFLRRRKRGNSMMNAYKGALVEKDSQGQGYTSPPEQDMVKYAYRGPVAELSDFQPTEMGSTSPVQRKPNELPA
jgi:hypothetical protein